MTPKGLENWLSNFSTPEEQFLSAMLLDQFSIRSHSQITSLLDHAVLTCLPNSLHTTVDEVLSAPNYIELLGSRHDQSHRIRLVPVIRDSDPPTKSGPSVARLYRRSIKIADCNMIWPWQISEKIEKNVTTIVFIDDMVGSGEQFCEFIKKHVPDKSCDATRYIYIPLLAHIYGLENIEKNCPFIEIYPIETADVESNFFYRPGTQDICDLRELYLKVANKHLNRRLFKKMALGYNGLAMTISYAHSTPNATLPLYWYESDQFYPLVSR